MAAKTVLKSKISEWEGLDHISSTIHQMPSIWREISKDDYGIDGEIEILRKRSHGEGYETTGGILKVQSKSGASYIVSDTDKSFAVKVNQSDLELWQKSIFPVLFIIYHPKENILYWKEVRSYIQKVPNVWRPPLKIEFQKDKDAFTSESLKALQEFASVGELRISTNESERLYSNLLPAAKMPTSIWSAPCTLSAKDIFSKVGKDTPAFLSHENRLFTFTDLTQDGHPFTSVISKEDIEPHDGSEWWIDEDSQRNYVRLLNHLLKSHLWDLGVHHNKHFNRYYFAIPHDVEEVKKTWYSVRTNRASVRTVAKKYKYGRDEFFRHDAASLTFIEIGGSWHLQIVPEYLFTIDGKTVWRSAKAKEYAIQQKAREWNQHVLNHVLRWSSTLSGSRAKEKIEISNANDFEPILVLERIPVVSITDFAIPHDPAVYIHVEEDKEQPLQLFPQQDLDNLTHEGEDALDGD